jgi:hypothetical protein
MSPNCRPTQRSSTQRSGLVAKTAYDALGPCTIARSGRRLRGMRAMLVCPPPTSV